jgi:hypothetical protein
MEGAGIMIHLGWKAGVEQYPPLEILDYAVAADEAGFDHVIVHTAGPDQRAFIRAYGREVRPRLEREAVAR